MENQSYNVKLDVEMSLKRPHTCLLSCYIHSCLFGRLSAFWRNKDELVQWRIRRINLYYGKQGWDLWQRNQCMWVSALMWIWRVPGDASGTVSYIELGHMCLEARWSDEVHYGEKAVLELQVCGGSYKPRHGSEHARTCVLCTLIYINIFLST